MQENVKAIWKDIAEEFNQRYDGKAVGKRVKVNSGKAAKASGQSSKPKKTTPKFVCFVCLGFNGTFSTIRLYRTITE